MQNKMKGNQKIIFIYSYKYIYIYILDTQQILAKDYIGVGRGWHLSVLRVVAVVI